MLMKAVSALLVPRARKELDRTRWVGELVRARRAELVKAAMAEGLLAHEALDVVQDGALSLLDRSGWHHLKDDPDGAAKLLATLVRNHARNLRRRHHRRGEGLNSLTPEQQCDDAALALERALDEAQAHIALTGCMNTLGQTQRAVVVARFLEGDSGREVAQQLGLTAGNVAVILHRARGQLRSCIEASQVRFGVE